MLLALLAGACIGQLDIERGCFTCIVGAAAGISTSPCRCCAINLIVVAVVIWELAGLVDLRVVNAVLVSLFRVLGGTYPT